LIGQFGRPVRIGYCKEFPSCFTLVGLATGKKAVSNWFKRCPLKISRRKLFEFAPLVAAAFAFPKALFGAGSSILGATGDLGELALQSMTSATFKPLVGTTFAVRSGTSQPAFLTLLSVTDIPQETAAGPAATDVNMPRLRTSQPLVNTFSLLFFGSGETLAQGTYGLQHSVLGSFPLFIVPGQITNYTAVISHISNPDLIHAAPKRIVSAPVMDPKSDVTPDAPLPGIPPKQKPGTRGDQSNSMAN
jgi:hypothetical protein